MPDIYAALEELKICYRETENCEADDWISGYAKRCGTQMEVVIASQDSDFFQLITKQVSVLRYRGKSTVICGPAYIREKLGIVPAQYAAYKSLTGDAADHIRGADRIGPKTAAELMNQFGDLQTLLAKTDEISKPSIRRSVLQNAARIRKNYELIRLDGTEELPFGMERLRWEDPGLTTTQVLQRIQ